MKNYLKRKIEELTILNNYLHKPINLENVKTIFEVLKKKEDIIKKLKEENSKRYYHDLTNKNRISFNSDFYYTYTYERFNGFLNIKNFVNKFYNLNKNIITQNYFTSSGMGAIASVLLSVISSNNVIVDLMYDETYFETIKFINMIMKNESTKKALYIDSIASDFTFEIDDYNDYELVIIDTTCFLGKQYNKMINKIISANIPCILVRSHTKLDLVGTEYSHIGSVSFIYHDGLSDNQTSFLEKIEADCKHLIGVIGACIPPEKFPTFMLDENLLKINEKRIETISNNNAYLFNVLEENNYKVILPNHKQFCLIHFENDKKNLKDLKNEIIDFCDNIKRILPIYHAVSFGFDYISIDCYENFLDGKFKVRICMNDTSKLQTKEVIDILLKLLKIMINY